MTIQIGQYSKIMAYQKPIAAIGSLSKIKKEKHCCFSGFFNFVKTIARLCTGSGLAARTEALIAKVRSTCPGIPPEALQYFLRPVLLRKTEEEMKLFDLFLDDNGGAYLTLLFASHNVKEGKEMLKRRLDDILARMKTNPDMIRNACASSRLEQMHQDSITPQSQFKVLDFLIQNPAVSDLPDALKRKTVIEALCKNQKAFLQAVQTYPLVLSMIGNRFTDSERLQYYDSLASIILNNPDKQAGEALSLFSALIVQAAAIQSERIIYHGTEKPDLFILQGDFLQAQAAPEPFLWQISSEIIDLTVVKNTQDIQENLGLFYKPIETQERNFTAFKGRSSHSLSLYVEYHPDLQLSSCKESVCLDHLRLNLAIANPKTMETRTLLFPLPFQGTVGKSQAKLRFALLEYACKHPDSYQKIRSTEELRDTLTLHLKKDEVLIQDSDWNLFLQWHQRQSIKKILFAWEKKTVEEHGKLTADFIHSRSFAYARELPEIQQALHNPQSLEALSKACSTKNIFSSCGNPQKGGALSLLPPEWNSPLHKEIGQLTQMELDQAYDAFTTGAPAALYIPAEGDKNLPATVAFNQTPLSIEGMPFLQVETILSSDGCTHARTTLYQLKGKTLPALKEEIQESGLFHRDLLLAKAELIKKSNKI